MRETLVSRVQLSLGCGFFLALLKGCSAEAGPLERMEPGQPTPAPGFSPPAAAPAPAPKPAPAARPAPEPTALAPAVAATSDAASEPSEPAIRDDEPAEFVREEPQLFAAAREVFVYDRPSLGSKKLGYLRAGARVTRSREPLSRERCAGGFYRVAPQGFVCVGNGARLEGGDAVSALSSVRPDRTAPMPYAYGRSRQPPPPLYVKLPSEAEQRATEPELGAGARSPRGALAALPLSPVPAELAAGKQLPTPFGYAYDRALVSAGRALSDSAFALLQVVKHGTRTFALTTDLLLVPLERLEAVSPSAFHGVSLQGEGAALPLAFVMSKGASLYAGSPSRGLAPARRLNYREAVFLSGTSQRADGARWLETRAGDWLRDEHLIKLEPEALSAPWASPGRSWLRISIGKQTLVAYQGEQPVYATLVSTGADGLGDPETTRSTVRGQFLIHTKHVSVTMDSDEAGDEFDLRDVPYVQYFKDNYALHAAYWHDGFGGPRSHGCINLAPLDARWLFQWTEPPVPPSWHGAFSLREGSLIDIVP